ncbi:DUF1365 domain-containing protein [Gemmobacter fulvus]|uniref:DUF1365 domain-containing protein n=1 Tax=Gemmobacter fulvus TaxID=2840474 RepID=A0A975S0A4_9RHOB|nr:DUF1365 domain-containing protein [Gemmobacter fulvus]MBT9245766.1 DUF1365 domain-containing protein [Gemmobacter fulvus]QWK89392.1 DUF1365 domain-containing protein [Gemmobacter fulvus]
MSRVDHIAGQTFHGRKGAVANSFRYGVDYLLLDPERAQGPGLFARNRRKLVSVWDQDHGGAPGQGRGVIWLREVLAAQGLPAPLRVELLAQPRILGHVFNPVSFWLAYSAEGLQAVVAEVTNTYGDRHSYLCHRADHGLITREDEIVARKIFHVSPFQPVEGDYRFRFDIGAQRIGIWIDHSHAGGGIYTNLIGRRVPLTNLGILRACLRRPFGSRRVLALIHWQALKLALKGAGFRNRPAPPADEISR